MSPDVPVSLCLSCVWCIFPRGLFSLQPYDAVLQEGRGEADDNLPFLPRALEVSQEVAVEDAAMTGGVVAHVGVVAVLQSQQACRALDVAGDVVVAELHDGPFR